MGPAAETVYSEGGAGPLAELILGGEVHDDETVPVTVGRSRLKGGARQGGDDELPEERDSRVVGFPTGA